MKKKGAEELFWGPYIHRGGDPLQNMVWRLPAGGGSKLMLAK